MADFRASIPGWLDAVQFEQAAHEAAFANPYDEICGVPVRHVSLMDIAQLAAIGNSLFTGDFPTRMQFKMQPHIQRDAYDVLCYLHLRQSKRRVVNWYRRTRYAKIDRDELYRGMLDYLNRTFIDQIGTKYGKVKNPISYWSQNVEYVDLLASEYGWTDNKILTMPYRRMIQLVRRTIKRNDSKFTLSSLSDRIVAKYLEEKNSKRNQGGAV